MSPPRVVNPESKRRAVARMWATRRYTRKEIADELGLSPSWVGTQVKKLGGE